MDCGICIQNFSEIPEKKKYFTLCSHSFCKDCFEEWEKVCVNENRDVVCPMCRYILQKVVSKDTEIEMNLIEDDDSEDFKEVEYEEEIEDMEWVENEISYLESMNNVTEEDYHFAQNQRYEMEFYGRVYTY